MACKKKPKKEPTPLEKFFDMVIGDYLGTLEESTDDWTKSWRSRRSSSRT